MALCKAQFLKQTCTKGLLVLGVFALAGCSWLGSNSSSSNHRSSRDGVSSGTSPQVSVQQAQQPARDQTQLITLEVPPAKDITAPSNVGVAYFWEMTVQSGTPEQRDTICQALHDMANLSARELWQKRYANADGEAGQWNVINVLQTYIVPAQAVNLNQFYEDISKPAAREVVRQTLVDLDDFCTGKLIPQEDAQQAVPSQERQW